MKARSEITDAPATSGREQLSSFVDGELDAAACERWIARLAEDGAARHEWSMLHLAGDALRSSEVACWHSEGFVERVAGAVAQEPTVLAPAFAARRRRLLQRVVLPGAAVAAAAAVLMVVALPTLRGPADTSVQARAPSAVAGSASAAADSAATALVRSPQMEAYLAAHREGGGAGVMPAATAYLRASAAVAEEGR